MAQIQVADKLSEVRQFCRECPTPTLIQAYVSAARMFCNKSRWLRVTVPGSTSIGTELYSLGADPYIEIIGIRAISIQQASDDTHPLTDSNSGSWDRNDDPACPDYYQYVPHGMFAVHPLPDQAYPLSVEAFVQPREGANSIDSSLLVDWDFALQAGALEYLLALPRQPWTDKVESRKQGADFTSYIVTATNVAERGYNPGAATTARNGGASGAVRTRMLPI